MPDDIQRTIYKLELDDSGYIKGVESLSASTNKLTAAQERANKVLKDNEAALKAQSEFLQQTKKDLETYTGTNEKYRQQLEKSFKDAQADNVKLTELVNNSRKAYERAQQAAQNFAQTSAKATQIQQTTTGGKIPTGVPVGVVSPIANLQITDLGAAAIQSSEEFNQLSIAIGLADERLKTLDENSEEFKLLKPIVDQGKVALQQYAEAAEQAAGSSVSLKSQIRQGREELVKLEEQGKGNTKEYFELEKKVAKLTDAFGDQQQRIKILASDTKTLDFGKAAITAATSAFQAYTSVSILFGDENSELQKKTLQLFAAMQLLQSLEQLSNLTRREGILGLHLQSAAQATYTAVVGASTGALKAFRVALLATGIGAAIVAIGFLIKKYNDYKDTLAQAGIKQKLLKEIDEKAIDSYSKQVVSLVILQKKLSDLSFPQSERIKLAKEYNETADKGNKIDIKQIDSIDQLNAAIGRQIEKIKERALAEAAANVTAEKATAFFKAQSKFISNFPSLKFDAKTLEQLREQLQQGTLDLTQFTKRQHQEFINAIANGDLKTLINAKKDFDQAVDIAVGFKVTTTKSPKEDKEVENVFLQKLKELQARLAELTAQSFQSEGTIRKQFQASLEKELSGISDLLKDKKITAPQAGILNSLIGEINQVQLKKSLDDFNKTRLEALKKLNDAIEEQENEAGLKRIQNVTDEFEREKQLIENRATEISTALIKKRDELLTEVDKSSLSDADKKRKKFIILGVFAELLDQNEVAKNKSLIDNSFKAFNSAVEHGNILFEKLLLQSDEKTAAEIQDAKKLYNEGAITYEEFQKRITQSLKDQKAERDKIKLLELNSDIKAINDRIAVETDAANKENLLSQQRKLRQQKADLESGTGDVEDPNKKKVETVEKYAQAIGTLTESIISFWQKQNEAEAKALDQSITLQERRVDAARRIADRGNAEYLKAEEDRLVELNIQRENAARKQLGIDAALQASQVLVGITGAISHIATGKLGAAQTIAEIAVIIGALATGFGIIKTLQGNQPKLAKGDPYVSRNGHPVGVDTIPAWLNEGEAVTSAEKNKAYHPVIRAIHDGTIPAEHLNDFVRTYHRIKGVPQPNYERIKEASQLHIGQDGKIAVLITEQNKKIEENNDLQRQTLRALKAMGVNVNMDRNGIAVSVMEVIDEIKIAKKI